MIAATVSLLLLGTLLGATVLFAAVLMPAVFRLLPTGMARAFIGSVFSLYYLFGAALSGAALALLVSQPCSPTLAHVVMALCCGAFILAWRELAPRILILRERGDREGLKRIEGAAQVLNTAQMAVVTAVFVQTLQFCA